MTPQQLMDLPSAGMAEKHLKAMGLWQEMQSDTDRIEWMEESGIKVHPDQHGDGYVVKPTGCETCWDTLRPAIDEASRVNNMRLYSAYKEGTA